MPAHLFAYQLANGAIDRPGWTAAQDPVVCHTCDFHGCTNPAHLRLGTAAENRAEWSLRRGNPHGPLADTRGAAGRTRAIAQAIRAGLEAGEPPERVEQLILAAEEEGLPLTLW
nr:HNH endonuclease [Streptomyces aureus]